MNTENTDWKNELKKKSWCILCGVKCEDEANHQDIIVVTVRDTIADIESLLKEQTQWISAKEKLPEMGRTVLVYDPKEEREIDKYGTDFLYTDPKGGIHWDWHFNDNEFYWKEFDRYQPPSGVEK